MQQNEVVLKSTNGTAITSTENVEVLDEPGAGFAYRIYYINMCNASSTDTIVSLREGESTATTDNLVFENQLTQYQPFNHAIGGGQGYWQLTANHGLYFKQSAAGSIYYTIEYTIVKV